MSTYSKQMQKIVDDYRAAGEPWPTSARNIADWAILTERWMMPTSVIRRRCADDLAAAMREEYYTDRRGRRVRVLHPAPLLVDGQREMIWDDIRTATRSHMQLSFQNRRQGIVGDCRQFKVDVDSYNESHPDQKPIQIVFNFERDLAEFDAADSAA